MDENIVKDDDSPLTLFLSMLRSPESKRQYPRRLQVFFNFLGLKGNIEAQSQSFVNQFKKDTQDDRLLQKKLLSFSRHQKESVDNKEISPSTVPNYFKAIKLFCQANNLSNKVEWKLITKSLPLGFKASDDRAPTIEEIQKLLEFPDRRIKPLVLTLVSSGIRIGAFETLKWKHITPINNKSNEVVAAKIRVYPGDREEYYSFLTVEAYNSLKDWMDYRSSCGEKINKESFVMRDIWQVDDVEGVQDPKPLNSFAITRLLNRAWQAQKIRPQLPKGVKRHEFKSAHGFRKYFKTQLEQARVPSIKIELLLGHSLGVSDSYAKFSENEMLEDYLLGADYVTVNQTVVLINKSLRKQEETIQNSLKEMEERHRKEMNALHENYQREMGNLKQDVEIRLQKVIEKIDVSLL